MELKLFYNSLMTNGGTLDHTAPWDKFKSHGTSHKIFSYPIKIRLLFVDTKTNTSHQVTNNVVKVSYANTSQFNLRIEYD